MPLVKAEREVCKGYGNCVMNLPDVFDVNGGGVVVLLKESIPEGQRHRLEVAVLSCPVSALSIQDDQ